MEELAKFQKSMDALTWSDTSLTLSEFLEKYGVPHLVRVKEGYYGMNEASSFEADQYLLLNKTRTRHTLMGQDSIGRAIAIPLDCENKVLVCPLSMECRQNQMVVAEIAQLFPNIKYFRVIENRWNERTNHALKPESILEIEKIDFKNSCVRFEDVDQAVPFNSSVIFEPLLDFREYTLREAVKYFGLPAKVRFLSTRKNAKEDLDDDKKFEKLISNLGKVTVLHNAEPEEVVVATKIDFDSLAKGKTSMNCSQVPKDFDLKISVSKKFKNDPAYKNIVKELNKAFLDSYDLRALDNLDKYEDLDLSREEMLCYALKPTGGEEEAPELPQRNRSGPKAPPACPPKPPHRRSKPTSSQLDKQKTETERQYEKCIFMISGRGVKEFKNSNDDHVYESIDSDDDYELMDESNHGHASMTSQKRVNMASHKHENMPSREHVNVTSQDDKNYTTSEYMIIPDQPTPPLQQKRSHDTKNSAELTTRLEPGSKLTSQSMASQEDQLYTPSEYMNIPDGSTSPVIPPNRSHDTKNSAELTAKLKSGSKTSSIMASQEDQYYTMSECMNIPDGSTALVIPQNRSHDTKNLRQLTAKLKTGIKTSPSMTSQEDQFYTASEYTNIPDGPTPHVPQNRSNDVKNSVELMSEYMKIPDRPTTPETNQHPTPQNRSSDSENSAEVTTRLEPDRENSLRVSPIPTEMSALSVSKLPCSDHEDSLTVPVSTTISSLNIPKQSGGQSSQKLPIPKDLSALSVAGVGGLLTSLNMDCYVVKFREEQVDGEMLVELDESELLSLDLKLFHVKKLMKVVKGWRPNIDSKGY